jgi:hypothetical protein
VQSKFLIFLEIWIALLLIQNQGLDQQTKLAISRQACKHRPLSRVMEITQ